MKAKKFLKIIQRECTDENCDNKTCPFYAAGLCVATELPADWKIKKILKAAKKARAK